MNTRLPSSYARRLRCGTTLAETAVMLVIFGLLSTLTIKITQSALSVHKTGLKSAATLQMRSMLEQRLREDLANATRWQMLNEDSFELVMNDDTKIRYTLNKAIFVRESIGKDASTKQDKFRFECEKRLEIRKYESNDRLILCRITNREDSDPYPFTVLAHLEDSK